MKNLWLWWPLGPVAQPSRVIANWPNPTHPAMATAKATREPALCPGDSMSIFWTLGSSFILSEKTGPLLFFQIRFIEISFVYSKIYPFQCTLLWVLKNTYNHVTTTTINTQLARHLTSSVVHPWIDTCPCPCPKHRSFVSWHIHLYSFAFYRLLYK